MVPFGAARWPPRPNQRHEDAMTEHEVGRALDLERWQQDATRTTTVAIIAKLEWAMLVYQFFSILTSVLVDPYAGAWQRTIIVVLAVAHIPLVPYYFRYGGPMSHGTRWFWLPASQAMMVTLLAGLLTQPGLYGNHSCQTLCSYVPPTMILFVMYVQIAAMSVAMRVVADAVIVLVPLLQSLAIMLVMNPEPTRNNLVAVFAGQLQLVIAYVIGKAAVAICRVSVGRQAETQQQSYDEFFNFLHSHVKAGIAAIKAVQPSVPAMLDKIEELERTVGDRRLQMLFVRDQRPLAVVLSERIRAFTGKLHILESPRVGAITVARPIGILISRALGDLLKNVVMHGGESVRIRYDLDESNIVELEVADNGDGFDPAVLDNDATSLHSLRHDARWLGGDLTMDRTDVDTVMRLRVPLQ
jgi:hypothetical protein